MLRLFALFIGLLTLCVAGCASTPDHAVIGNTLTVEAMPGTAITPPANFKYIGLQKDEKFSRKLYGHVFAEVDEDRTPKRAIMYNILTSSGYVSAARTWNRNNCVTSGYITVNGKDRPTTVRCYSREYMVQFSELAKKSNLRVPSMFLTREVFFKIDDNTLFTVVYGEDVSDMPYNLRQWHIEMPTLEQRSRLQQFERNFAQLIDLESITHQPK